LKTHVDRHSRRLERGEMDSEEKFGRGASHDEGSPNGRVEAIPKES